MEQIALFKSQADRVLLAWATNYISQLDPALQRPGRFDCIIPVGELDEDSRTTILQYYLTKLNAEQVDLDLIVKMTPRFMPADIEYLFQTVAQFSFEQEYASGQDCRVSTDTFAQILPKIRPTLTYEIGDNFKKDSITYSRT